MKKRPDIGLHLVLLSHTLLELSWCSRVCMATSEMTKLCICSLN